MTVNIKDRISQLAEINRALVEDLDVSHQMVAKYSGERETLQGQVDGLNQEVRRLESSCSGVDDSAMREIERLRVALSEAQRESSTLHRERDALYQGLEKSRHCAKLAENKLYTLAEQYVALEEEKSHVELELGELNSAMKDIRYNLISACQSESQEIYMF